VPGRGRGVSLVIFLRELSVILSSPFLLWTALFFRFYEVDRSSDRIGMLSSFMLSERAERQGHRPEEEIDDAERFGDGELQLDS
jgi:hypothetical protein